MIGSLAVDLPPNHQPDDAPLLVEPRLIELCFQTAGILELGTTGRLALPLRVGRVLVFPVTEPVGTLASGGDANAPTGAASMPSWSTTSGTCASPSRPTRPSPCRAASTRARSSRCAGDAMTRRAGRRPLSRIAVVDGGEIALRLIRAVREYRLEHARDLRVVALAGDADAGNLWVREADEAVLVAGDGWTDPAAIEQTLADSRRRRHVGRRRIARQPSAACRGLRAARDPAHRSGMRPAHGCTSAPIDPTAESARRIDAHAWSTTTGTMWIVGLTEGTALIESALLTPELDRLSATRPDVSLAGQPAPGACSVCSPRGRRRLVS